MSRVYNFSAGPAVLPEPVLKELAEEMMDYQGCGMSVMEMSHRSPEFQKIIDEAEQDRSKKRSLIKSSAMHWILCCREVMFFLLGMQVQERQQLFRHLFRKQKKWGKTFWYLLRQE